MKNKENNKYVNHIPSSWDHIDQFVELSDGDVIKAWSLFTRLIIHARSLDEEGIYEERGLVESGREDLRFLEEMEEKGAWITEEVAEA